MAESTLYFICRASDGAIKIGITTNLDRRLTDLRRQHGDLTLLGIVVGAYTREKLAHLIFADTRLDGEFFRPTPALQAFIDQYAVPPPPPLSPRAEPKRFWHKRLQARPWIDRYSDPLTVYERAQLVRDCESWIAQGLVAPSKHQYVETLAPDVRSRHQLTPARGRARASRGWSGTACSRSLAA
jgi:hypothetical protein